LPVRREIMKENKIKEILAQPVMLWGGRNKQVLSQGSIDMLTKQIADLSIKTQATKAKLYYENLHQKEIKELEKSNAEYQEDCVELARQLVEVDEKHQKETEGIFEEIEAMFEPTVPMTMKYEDWRALKKKLGGKDG